MAVSIQPRPDLDNVRAGEMGRRRLKRRSVANVTALARGKSYLVVYNLQVELARESAFCDRSFLPTSTPYLASHCYNSSGYLTTATNFLSRRDQAHTNSTEAVAKAT